MTPSSFDVMFSQTAQLMRKTVELDEDAHASEITWQACLIRCNLQALSFEEKQQFAEGQYNNASYEGYFREQDNVKQGDRIVAPPHSGGEIYEVIALIDELRVGDARIGRVALLKWLGNSTNQKTSEIGIKFSVELPS